MIEAPQGAVRRCPYCGYGDGGRHECFRPPIGLHALTNQDGLPIRFELCYGIELNLAYVDVAVERWQQFTGQQATLERDERNYDGLKTEKTVAGERRSDGNI